jgi:two-component system response regulator HydG
VEQSILIIDDDADICTLLQRYLIKNGFEADTAYSGNKILDKFKEKKYDLVFCDYRLGKKEGGEEILVKIKNSFPDTVVVIMTAYSDIRIAVNMIKLGAFDYITKPFIPEELVNIIHNALDLRDHPKKKYPLQKNPEKGSCSASGSDEFIVGESPAITELYKYVDIIAPTNYSVILYGESGSGKEVIAQTIHKKSTRKNGPFVAIDCGVLSKELANSELFGHMKGSFTGAYAEKEGLLEMANSGTLFLDEVANLSYDIQAALLRVIQERKMKKTGGNTEIDLNIRILTASHENLRKAYQKGLFREDLFHRLNEFSLYVPPLRDRREDIPLFAAFFLEKTNHELNKNITGFEKKAMEIFVNYSWPGNLREFRNVIRKAVLVTSSGKITTQALPMEIIESRNLNSYPEASDIVNSVKLGSGKADLKDVSAALEYQAILEVLESVNFNKTKAAEILGIDRKTLYNKIKNHTG